MTTSNNVQQSQAGPIAQQLAKIRSNGQATTSQLDEQRSPKKKSKWGFSDKSLWEWMQLLIVPLMLALITIGFSSQQGIQQNALSQRQHDTDQQIAADNRQADQVLAKDQQREVALKNYMDDLKDLLLNRGLKTMKQDDEVAIIARAETLSAMRQLDGQRKGILVQFLYEARLINKDHDVIDLHSADLSEANLSGTDLYKAYLYGVNLNGANLSDAQLGAVNLYRASLNYANLQNAYIGCFIDVTAKGVFQYCPILNDAVFHYANLENANFIGADLGGADLQNADLQNANLRDVDLSYANLQNAKVTMSQLAQAKSLKGATMPDGSVHP